MHRSIPPPWLSQPAWWLTTALILMWSLGTLVLSCGPEVSNMAYRSCSSSAVCNPGRTRDKWLWLCIQPDTFTYVLEKSGGSPGVCIGAIRNNSQATDTEVCQVADQEKTDVTQQTVTGGCSAEGFCQGTQCTQGNCQIKLCLRKPPTEPTTDKEVTIEDGRTIEPDTPEPDNTIEPDRGRPEDAGTIEQKPDIPEPDVTIPDKTTDPVLTGVDGVDGVTPISQVTPPGNPSKPLKQPTKRFVDTWELTGERLKQIDTMELRGDTTKGTHQGKCLDGTTTIGTSIESKGDTKMQIKLKNILCTGFFVIVATIGPRSITLGQTFVMQAELKPEERQFVQNLMGSVKVDTTKKKITFSGVNVQIDNGTGKTETTNQYGNLTIGYNETNSRQVKRTGSHNLLVGNGHEYTSFGGVAVGKNHTISNIFASVCGGVSNKATGEYSSVSGGSDNSAGGEASSVSGGRSNTASGEGSSVSGGGSNQASGERSSISGGSGNYAHGGWSSISGGRWNRTGAKFGKQTCTKDADCPSLDCHSEQKVCMEKNASDGFMSISGGVANLVYGESSSVTGGHNNAIYSKFSTISGGRHNLAGAFPETTSTTCKDGADCVKNVSPFSYCRGGTTKVCTKICSKSSDCSTLEYCNIAIKACIRIESQSGNYASISGGERNTTMGEFSHVAGGSYNIAGGRRSHISGGEANHVEGPSNGSVIVGGTLNVATGNRATVLGGSFATQTGTNTCSPACP